LVVATYGHAGDGNLHPQILYDEYDPVTVEKMEKVEKEIFQLAISFKGTLTGEHGIGTLQGSLHEPGGTTPWKWP